MLSGAVEILNPIEIRQDTFLGISLDTWVSVAGTFLATLFAALLSAGITFWLQERVVKREREARIMAERRLLQKELILSEETIENLIQSFEESYERLHNADKNLGISILENRKKLKPLYSFLTNIDLVRAEEIYSMRKFQNNLDTLNLMMEARDSEHFESTLENYPNPKVPYDDLKFKNTLKEVKVQWERIKLDYNIKEKDHQ